MAYAATDHRRRWSGALAAGLVQVALVVLIVRGLAGHYADPGEQAGEPALVAFSEAVRPPSPPPPPPRRQSEPAGEGAPPARKAEALPREVPSPKVMVAPVRPAATEAGKGIAATAGLAAGEGPSSGAGGTGNGMGTGSGGSGRGGGVGVPAARVAGALSDRDYPRSAARRRAAGTAAVSFRVRADGRVDRCSVIASSGDTELDALTCTLVQRRFVYRPARGADGAPVETTVRSTFTWGTR